MTKKIYIPRNSNRQSSNLKKLLILGLNMFLVPINIPTFYFSPSKIFLQLLVPLKFSITAFGPYFKVCLVLFNEIMQICVEYCNNLSQK